MNIDSFVLELLEWVRSKIPEYNINNFTNDWCSGTSKHLFAFSLSVGKAIAALAEAVLPGQMNLPADFSNDPVRDAHMGITKAHQNMNIPPIIDAEDMVHSPDELSNMTYGAMNAFGADVVVTSLISVIIWILPPVVLSKSCSSVPLSPVNVSLKVPVSSPATRPVSRPTLLSRPSTVLVGLCLVEAMPSLS